CPYRSRVTAMLSDHLDRRLTHDHPIRKQIAPSDRGDVQRRLARLSVERFRFVQIRSRIRISAALEEQSCRRGIRRWLAPLPAAGEVVPKVWVRHDGVKKRRVSTKSILVDARANVHVHPAIQQPPSDVELRERNRAMQQCRARERRLRKIARTNAPD